jgi:Tn3 transposase DDE domain
LALKRQVAALLPRIDLPEMLLEVQARTGFMDAFTHLHEGQARIADFPITVCATLIASACNIGLAPLICKDIAALTRDRLQWVQQNYLRLDTLIAANARLVAAQTEIELAQAWGGGICRWHPLCGSGENDQRSPQSQIFWSRARHHLLQLHLRPIYRIAWTRGARNTPGFSRAFGGFTRTKNEFASTRNHDGYRRV